MGEENVNKTVTYEIDKVGGWLLEHHTRTWTRRVNLNELAQELNEKKALRAELDEDISKIEQNIEDSKE